jgi:hypothetical protein
MAKPMHELSELHVVAYELTELALLPQVLPVQSEKAGFDVVPEPQIYPVGVLGKSLCAKSFCASNASGERERPPIPTRVTTCASVRVSYCTGFPAAFVSDLP